MKMVAIQFTYHTDIIEVPDFIELEIQKIQKRFDKWLYDKSIDHGYWVIVNGKKMAVSFDTCTFVDYINSFVLADSALKARIVAQNVPPIQPSIPTLFF